ncbi:sodium/hydrogen exchanger 10-like [Patiria miniata]|uniref:Cyclic nucleotide-binding domain-containing protein n=1 Tax=Patiria miniata TaxID=46514 RepID=A0A913Z6D8_PATMI|nr:sodium/hydrogen exchanger 10-like [Patiria miniata]
MAVQLGASFYVAVLAVVAAQFLRVTWGSAPAHDVAGHPVTAGPGVTNGTVGNGTATEIHAHPPPYEIVFLFGSCVFGALVRTLLQKVPVPYTVVLLILGVGLGLLSDKVPEIGDYTTSVAHMDPHLLLHVFLPVLIFESAFAMDVHTFVKSFVQVCILAILGLLVASALTAVLAMYVFSYNWSFSVSMMFGAIMSATDPVAVVALLKDLGASKQLGTLIEGESLLNDGCSIVLSSVFKEMSVPNHNSTASSVTVYFLRVALGGPAFGFAMAKITTAWLSYIFNDAMVEISITLASTYLTFYFGESVLGVSGVLAVVVLGLIVNAERTAISPEVEVFLHRFWEMLAYIANTLIFMLVGLVITKHALANVDPIDWFYVLALYVGINIIRGLVIAMFSPILSRIGYGLSWRNGVIMTWGGLRGAVSLAMALLVSQSEELDSQMIGSKVLFHTSGIVVLTLLINATTIQWLLKMLGMSDISVPKRLAMANAVRRIQEGQARTFAMLKADRFLADADWTIAVKAAEIHDPYKTTSEEEGLSKEAMSLAQRSSVCPSCHTDVPNEPSPLEYAEMMDEARLRMLKAEQVSYWKQFEHGMLSREAVRMLVGYTETAADQEDGFISVTDLKKNWEIKGIYPYLKLKLEELIRGGKTQEIPDARFAISRVMFAISNHVAFEVSIMAIIILNMIPIIMAFVVQEDHPLYVQYKPGLKISNYIFTVIYSLEAIIKVIGWRKYYIFSNWNKFDLFILIMSFVDIILDETIGDNKGFNPSLLKVVKLIRLLRGLRMLRLFKVLIPKLINFLNGRINLQLSLGYDVGKGFVLGEEEVSKLIDRLVDNDSILDYLKNISETNRLECIRELGMLQRVHPGIAVSVKTRQSIRTVLNHSRDTIRELQGAGLIDEGEAHKLEKVVEIKMKQLMNAPSSIPPPPPENLLKNVPWIEGDKKLIDFIKARAELLHFDYGDVIVREGDIPNGIYLIVSGLVKLFGQSEYLDHELASSHSVTVASGPGHFEDYLSVGNVIGEMGVLTGRPRNATVSCETATQVYYINLEDMQIALETFTLHPSLLYRLWRIIAIRIATPLMLEQIAFQGWTQEKIKLHLERGFLPDLEDEGYSFEIEDTVDDVILIQGRAIDAHTRDELVGPHVIPRSVHRLTFKKDDRNEPKILVVPNQNITLPVLDGRISIHGSTVSVAAIRSNLCLRHASRVRLHNTSSGIGGSGGINRRPSRTSAKKIEAPLPPPKGGFPMRNLESLDPIGYPSPVKGQNGMTYVDEAV